LLANVRSGRTFQSKTVTKFVNLPENICAPGALLTSKVTSNRNIPSQNVRI
jgi:hypothetical protein